MDIPFLQDLLIILSLATLVVFVFKRLKLPAILGFILTGTLAGPHVMGWVGASHEVEITSEIGIILLLFVIGIEFSIKQLAAIKKTVFLGGFLQVFLTVLFTAGTFMLLDYTWQESVFIGFLFSLSSTAIVLKMLQERKEITKPHGRMVLGVLIFQDIIVVPMMLFTPIIAGGAGDVGEALVGLGIKFIVLIVLTYVLARFIVPRLLHEIAKTRSRELFILATVVICFAVAWVTDMAGLSPALGAFLAGLIISESEYSHQATGVILPFRELFTGLFFVSIGMLLNTDFLIDHLVFILLLVVLVMLGKALIAWVAARLLSYSVKASLLTAFSIFQVGEFAFILSEYGLEYQLLGEVKYQYFLAVSILSMAVTPFVINASNTLVGKVLKTGSKIVPDRFKKSTATGESEVEEFTEITDHLIIIGFGLNGQNVARAAKYSEIPFVAAEMNPKTVKKYKEQGEPIIFGEASNPHILHTLNIEEARVVVVAISDAESTKTILREIRQINDKVHVIIRTRYVKEIDELIELGADEVIPEEFETSIEIFSRTMHKFLVPLDHIDHLADKIRSDNYTMLRPGSFIKAQKDDIIPRLDIECIRVTREGGKVEGKTVLKAQVRERFNVSIVALMRENNLISNIAPDIKIKRDDLLYVTGKKQDLDKFAQAVKIPVK